MITDFLARLFTRSRLALTLGVLTITGLAIRGYLPDPPVETPPRAEKTARPATEKKDQNEKPPERPARERIESEFNLTRADCLLIVDADKLFTPRTMEAVRQMVRDVEALDIVDSLIWLESVPIMNVFGLPDPLLPPDGSSAERLRIARERALEHPLVAGQLLSDDGNALQMPIRFDWLYATREDSGGPEIRDAAIASLARSLGGEADGVRVRITGRIPLWKAERDAYGSDFQKYQTIAYSSVVILALLLFRGLAPVVIVAVAPALAVFWTFGLLELFDHSPNDMAAIVMPVLVAMVSFTDGVHLMIHIRRQRADGLAPVDAAAASIRLVGLPCFLTSLTTAVGFCSLQLASSQYIRDFGIDCAVGVVAGFVAVITVIPLLSSTWFGRGLASRHEDDLVGRSLDRLTPAIDWIVSHARLVTAAGVAFTAAAALYASQLRPDEKWEYAMPTGTEAYQAMAWCDGAFGGIEYAHVKIQWPDETPPARVLTVVREVQHIVEGEPLLKHPLSIDDVLQTFPTDRDDTATLMSFASLLPPPLRDMLYNPQAREANVLMRCQDRGIRLYAPVFKRIDASLLELSERYPEFAFDLDGGPVWRAENLYQVVVDLASSLGTATVIILLIMTVVYRSMRIGLIAVIPNMLPLIVTAGLLVWTDYALTIAAVCAFTCCLGIAVDDTIHFLSRFQAEFAVDGDVRSAVHRSFLGVGTALVTTTVVLVCGFSTVLGSKMPAHRVFAGMAVSTIGTALIGDLILLPAMLATFYNARRRPQREIAAATDSSTTTPPASVGTAEMR